MVDIEPYEYQRKTNLKEHNDLVAKINEIVDVINNTNLDRVLPKISKLETDVSTIEATDSLQWTDIENLKTKNTEYDTHFGLNDTQIADINKFLVSDVALINGTTTGNVKVRIGRNDAPSIDSDDYNIQKPTSVELVQGSAPAMVKAQITLSDGTVLISDDFMFTTEAIGQDVYISSFVFKNGNVAGTISADIGLSNGTTLEANNFVVPTDPNVTNAIADLQTRMTAVEGGTIKGLAELKATVDGHTTSISALDSDVANLQIDKADVSTVETLTNTVNGKVNIAQGTGNAGKVLGINASGNVEPTVVSGGEVWEEVDNTNWPTNWKAGDRVKIAFNANLDYSYSSVASSWETAPTTNSVTVKDDSYASSVIEIIIPDSVVTDCSSPPIRWITGNTLIGIIAIHFLYPAEKWNTANTTFILLKYSFFNGGGSISSTFSMKTSTHDHYLKMWRLKK